MTAKKEMIRFSIAGAIATTIDFSLYYLLLNFFNFSISKGISFTCAGIVSYALNKYWIFEHSQSSYTVVRRYVLIILLALESNVLTNQIILYARPGAVYLALLSAATVTGLLTFISFKWWVFKV